MPLYKVADVLFFVEPKTKYTANLLKPFSAKEEDAGAPVELEIALKKEDVLFEKEKSEEAGHEKVPVGVLESLAVYRKFCDFVLRNKEGILFHSSAVKVGDKAYLFTAPSGTGKSTHARLWGKVLGDKLVYINDDKPIVRKVGGEFFVYGTPWNGKHNLGENTRAKLCAVCEIRRNKENFVERLKSEEMLPVLLSQTVRPSEPEIMDKLLSFLGDMMGAAKLYRINCNEEIAAAEIAVSEITEK